MTNFLQRATTPDNDWLWGNSMASLWSGQAAVAGNVQTGLLFFQNDFFADISGGVDWFGLLSSTGAAQVETQILLQCREIIINSYGITAINNLDVVENAAERAIQLLYNLSSIFTTNFSGTVQPAQSP